MIIVAVPDQCDAGACASVNRNYTRAVLRGGHLPFILPFTDRRDIVRSMLDRCDALLLTGGGEDVDPARYHCPPSDLCHDVSLRRDLFEWYLLDEAVRRKIPVMGICRGLQVINVYFGGNLYQDLPTDFSPAATFHQTPSNRWGAVHPVTIQPDTRLHQLLGVDRLMVNSTHHQAIRDLAPGFIASAVADDGIIEAIESVDYPVTAVQFHPERRAVGADDLFTRLFASFLSPLSLDH